MIRVWFNHWFSTAYNIINLLKEDETEIIVIGSNQRKHSVIQNACDEWYEEPALDGEEYIHFCLQFCQEHQIDVFIPRRKLVDISKHIEQFKKIGVKVMVDPYERIQSLNNKELAYQLFQGHPRIKVPEHIIVRSVEEFQKAYDILSKQYEKVCFKLVQDEGGMSFRVIDNSVDIANALNVYPSTKISLKVALQALKERKEFKEIMMMPYLPGYEISVDCLKTVDGIIAVPRKKGPSRDESIEFDEDILQMCYDILEVVPLEYPCNIQFKYLDQIPYFLEVNTRMSGGIQMGCLAAGVNIPNIALNKLLGIQKSWQIDRSTKRVSYIEIPQIVSE
ncbi:MAG: ATP-grasp domain-containing protein [Clostridiales bacterium]|nr:ATP-grasp domain-containing protein [Clostridiales bacterium]